MSAIQQALEESQEETEESPLPDGIYFDLPEQLYRRDPALGSSNMRDLLIDPTRYWWNSPYNPVRPKEKESPWLIRGKAMHKCVLEGRKAFEAIYIRGPDHQENATPSEKAAITKRMNSEAKKNGQIVLPAETYDRIIVASAIIAQNPALSGAFQGGYPEVSVFWERDDVRRKARFDYLKVRAVPDLKSIGNERDLAFPQACRNSFASYNYEIQATHYLEARSLFPEFWEDGKVFALGDRRLDSIEFAERCAGANEYAFQWIFLQAEGAPITWSLILSPGNPVHEVGKLALEQAAANYRYYMEEYGPGEMWPLIEEPHEVDAGELPAWWGRYK